MSLVDGEVTFQSLLPCIVGKWSDHGPRCIPCNHVGLNYKVVGLTDLTRPQRPQP